MDLQGYSKDDLVQELARRQREKHEAAVATKNEQLRQEIIEMAETLKDGLPELHRLVKREIGKIKKAKAK